jgi:hypothetical protein
MSNHKGVQMTVAIVYPEAAPLHDVKWPKDLDVKAYTNTFREVQKVASMARQGHFEHIVVSSKHANAALATLRGSGARIHMYPKSITSLAKELHAVIGIAPPPVEEEALVEPLKQRPFVRVGQATAQPQRRPPWSDDERTALLMAYEGAINWDRVIEGYLDLTSEIDVPVRSQAELRTELARLRGPTPDDDGSPERAWDVLYACAAVVAIDAVHDRNRRLARILHEMIGDLESTQEVLGSVRDVLES